MEAAKTTSSYWMIYVCVNHDWDRLRSDLGLCSFVSFRLAHFYLDLDFYHDILRLNLSKDISHSAFSEHFLALKWLPTQMRHLLMP